MASASTLRALAPRLLPSSFSPSPLLHFPPSRVTLFKFEGDESRCRIVKESKCLAREVSHRRRGGSVATLVAVFEDGVTGAAGSAAMEVNENCVGAAEVKKDGCVKAVFFDLDDTLVLTHAADKVAQLAVLVLAERNVPHINGVEMVKVFVEKFDVSPWDRTHQVDVREWRARIWNEALQSQGVDDLPLARNLQDLFDKERLLSFQWAPGVESVQHSPSLSFRWYSAYMN